MGRALYDAYPAARAVFEEADDALGFALSDIIFNGPEDTLKLTEHTQPAILTVSIAASASSSPSSPPAILPIAYAAGHSLGEYSAHVAAGTFSFADAVRTVRAPRPVHAAAVPAGQGAMAAILGLNLPDIEATCAAVSAELAPEVVTTANLNSPDQTVISGSAAAVARAAELCKEAGAKRAVMLPVSGPFHSALMMPAQDQLEHQLESVIPFHHPRFPVASNVDARLLLHPTPSATPSSARSPARPLGRVHPPTPTPERHPLHRSRPRQSPLRPQPPDRPHPPSTTNVEDPASLEKTLAALGPSGP
jgi:[acyl-carrier-protein] S-malonyltransferase